MVEGLRCLDIPAFSRAVPPRGRRRPARRQLPVRPLPRSWSCAHPGGPPKLDAQARRHPLRPGHRVRPDRHRPGGEFDYSGTQACRVLRAEGVRVILVNSEPRHDHDRPRLRRRHLHRADHARGHRGDHRGKEKPDAMLPTLGGPDGAQRGDRARTRQGSSSKYGVELIGAKVEAIKKGEDRQLFKELVHRARRGCRPHPHRAHASDEVPSAAAGRPGLPARRAARRSPWAALGSGFAYDERGPASAWWAPGLHQSPTTEVLLEESILGWKEYELELMRDTADNTVVVCSIENVDPVRRAHRRLDHRSPPRSRSPTASTRTCATSASTSSARVGVDTGGCNIQFAVDPANGRVIVIEMNPRVSRSSAPRVEGHRLPDRQDRREARDRLPASTRSRTTSPRSPRRASSRRSTTSW